MKPKYQGLWIGLALLFCLLLAGCGKEVTISVFDNQTWTVEQVLSMNTEVIPSISGDIGGGIGLDFNLGSMTDSFIKFGFDEAVAQYESMGLKASWWAGSANNETTYNLNVSGEDFQSLADWGLGGKAKELLAALGPEYQTQVQMMMNTVTFEKLAEENTYHLSIIPSPEMQNTPNFGTTIRLNAGKIIRSNATRVSGETAIWRNPTMIEVVFQPAAAFNFGAAALVGGGALAGVGLIFGLYTLLQGASAAGPRPGRYAPPPRRPVHRDLNRPRR